MQVHFLRNQYNDRPVPHDHRTYKKTFISHHMTKPGALLYKFKDLNENMLPPSQWKFSI